MSLKRGAYMIDQSYRMTVLSDTHMPKKAKELPAALLDNVRQSEFILHAGDWSNGELYEEPVQYAPVDGVPGECR